jgi:hypothetical protein
LHFSCPLFPVVLYAADSVGFYYCHDRGSIAGCVSVIAAVCRRFSTLPSSRSMSAFPDKLATTQVSHTLSTEQGYHLCERSSQPPPM